MTNNFGRPFAINMTNAEFVSEAKRQFSFLEIDFGFSSNVPDPVSKKLYTVEYSSETVTLQVFFGKQDGVGIRFRLPNAKKPWYYFHTYLRIVDLETARLMGFSIARSDAAIIELLSLNQTSLRSVGVPLLRGDVTEFQRLKDASEHGVGLDSPFEPSSEKYC